MTTAMSQREDMLDQAASWFDQGHLFDVLRRRVAHRTDSQEPDSPPRLARYLEAEIGPAITALGFTWRVLDNPVPGGGPFLIGERHEGAGLPTLFTYGHGDVVRGYDAEWREGRSPWILVAEGERWYGRGTADNKGQHSINLAALGLVLAARGRLGFNVKLLVETSEEIGSPGLHALCDAEKEALKADLLIASDGPRLRANRPTLFLGARGACNFDLTVQLRDGGHHSGNWGGLLANPGTILANAIASLIDARGRILVEGLRPASIPEPVRQALAGIEPGEPGGPTIDADWGEPGLSAAERVFGWNALEVLAFTTGNPARPVNAIPPVARAHLQLRFVPGVVPDQIVPILRDHLDRAGFPMVTVSSSRETAMAATRLDPDTPWVRWAAASIAATTGALPAILPNLGGSLPNDCFAELLGLPTIWVPHSYPGCSQHAPDEHLLAPVVREGLLIMTGLFWDLGADPTDADAPDRPSRPLPAARPA
jgi:acetylornithine deacetylase/succinyl-diaminopimelate desuccinylase-like protein